MQQTTVMIHTLLGRHGLGCRICADTQIFLEIHGNFNGDNMQQLPCVIAADLPAAINFAPECESLGLRNRV